VTPDGGANEVGTVFKVTPAGKETVVYSFCSKTNCSDGYYPNGGLAMDNQGNLYGMAGYGGTNQQGVVFKVTPAGTQTVLYNFCSLANCTDGSEPSSSPILDDQGNLYGTTFSGGANNDENVCVDGCGTVFRLTPKGKETVLYSFCAVQDCEDGYSPDSSLMLDARGNLYGTTDGEALGGTVITAFKLSKKGMMSVLDYLDSESFWFVTDNDAHLYGTEQFSGANNAGEVFELAE
jgi:uncharacterized repeat protein (TIGR03803 family)